MKISGYLNFRAGQCAFIQYDKTSFQINAKLIRHKQDFFQKYLDFSKNDKSYERDDIGFCVPTLHKFQVF